ALDQQYRANTNNIPLAFQLISIYLVTQQTNAASQLLDELLSRTNADASTLLSAAQVYAQLLDAAKLEASLERLVQAIPTQPEAWYDLAAIQASRGKTNEAIASLGHAIELSQQRLKAEP